MIYCTLSDKFSDTPPLVGGERAGSLISQGAKDRQAQTLAEYVILIGIVLLVLTAMTPAVRRGIQSIVKVTADQLGNQHNADQSADEESGYLVSSKTSTTSFSQKTIGESPNYSAEYRTRGSVATNATSEVNLGFTNRVFSY